MSQLKLKKDANLVMQKLQEVKQEYGIDYS